jgi:nitroimidazol reductase NimA-like FMN-containing flavoprotein (pyridoxamine 5'-phosphate oxidase superfamily)
MRRNDKKINSREEMDAVIRASKVCRIAYAYENTPYITPVSFGYDGQSIFVHTAEEGRKIDFLKKNNYICFEFDIDVRTVSDEKSACNWTAAYKSLIGYGRMIRLDKYEEKEYAIDEIMKHYSGKRWGFDEKALKNVALWKIEIETLSGKQSKAKD